MHQDHQEACITDCWAPRVSDSAGLGWGLRTCTVNNCQVLWVLLYYTQNNRFRVWLPWPLTFVQALRCLRKRHILLPHKCSVAPLGPGQSLSCSSASGTRLQCPAPPGSPPRHRRCLGLAILTTSGRRKKRTWTCLRELSQGSQGIFHMVAHGLNYNNMGKGKADGKFIWDKSSLV